MGGSGSKQTITNKVLNTTLIESMVDNRQACLSNLDLSNAIYFTAKCGGDILIGDVVQTNTMKGKADCTQADSVAQDIQKNFKANLANEIGAKNNALTLPWSPGLDADINSLVANFTSNKTSIKNFMDCMSNITLKNNFRPYLNASGNCKVNSIKQTNYFDVAVACFAKSDFLNTFTEKMSTDIESKSKSESQGALSFISDVLDSALSPLNQFGSVAKWAIVAAVIASIIGAIVVIVKFWGGDKKKLDRAAIREFVMEERAAAAPTAETRV
jgi:hypothetical protein